MESAVKGTSLLKRALPQGVETIKITEIKMNYFVLKYPVEFVSSFETELTIGRIDCKYIARSRINVRHGLLAV